jgi:hypothetical protein
MSYAFIKTMRANPEQSYVEVNIHKLVVSGLLLIPSGASKHTTGISSALPADSSIVGRW